MCELKWLSIHDGVKWAVVVQRDMLDARSDDRRHGGYIT